MKLQVLFFSCSMFITACQDLEENVTQGEIPADSESTIQSENAMQYRSDLTGRQIIEMAHAAAGGEIFVNPGSLFLSGHNTIYGQDGGISIWDKYAMWRVFTDEKSDAHTATGKVRIEAWQGQELAMLISYDGQATYDMNGRMENQSANAMWSNNFGYGAIRNALDEGWTQMRRADRTIDGKPAFMIELSDPDGGETLFGFEQDSLQILYVGFDTPRGWHERRYSDYFSKPGSSWQQAGRVRLFYNGIMANEATWTDFEIGETYAEGIFVIDEVPSLSNDNM
ncbi:MAG: hypothetical protein OXE78_14930 [Gammaproteobacteria bacterium]|nr:hypothetical protein [Gammaproteobacteria bacterium]